MPGFRPGIHEFLSGRAKIVDAKAEPWHDGCGWGWNAGLKSRGVASNRLLADLRHLISGRHG
jgi:hypothetical protein